MGTDDGREAAAPGERVRFCLRCGAVMEFALSRCPACGHAEPAPAAGAARVACEGCGTARPAELRICPACGREAPGDWPPVQRASYAPPRASASRAWLVLLAWLAPALAALGVALALR